MKKYKNIPIASAKKIAEQYDKEHVIIITWDSIHSKTHVTTYGKTLEACKQAVEAGNKLKKAMGWPDELCHAVPTRVKNKS